MSKAEMRKEAAQQVIDSRDKLRHAIAALPATMQVAAGKQLNAIVAAVDSLSDLLLILNEEVKS